MSTTLTTHVQWYSSAIDGREEGRKGGVKEGRKEVKRKKEEGEEGQKEDVCKRQVETEQSGIRSLVLIVLFIFEQRRESRSQTIFVVSGGKRGFPLFLWVSSIIYQSSPRKSP